MKLDAFTRGFLECALWSTTDESTDQGGAPLDQSFTLDDIHENTLAGMIAECERFQREHAADIDAMNTAKHNPCFGPRSEIEACFGHDFWLTRNGHGAGFWDGDYPEEMGEHLTEASHAYGEVNLYVGDDGKIYAMGYELKVSA